MDCMNLSESYYDEMLRLLRELCVIPAPSGFEDERAKYVLNYLHNLGIKNAYIDEAKNVICTLGKETDQKVVFMAHTDIVFPFETPLNLVDDGEKLYCPGVGDDTARLVMLLVSLKYIMDHNIQLNKTILFSANSCEEGLGNLKGCRQIFKDFEGEISRMYTIDGSNSAFVNRSVGSHRYKVTAITEGGHSYGAFGNRNAINVLAGIISKIYEIEVPKVGESKTTYNVGTIEGGTTVNTIAQKATMLAEYRSDDVECLSIMKEKFQAIFEEGKTKCESLEVELVGDRPCMSTDIDMEKMQAMSELVASVQSKYGKCDVSPKSGSTDANIPLSLGIPAICVGAGIAGKAHTTEEWIDKESLKSGLAIVLELILTEGEVL